MGQVAVRLIFSFLLCAVPAQATAQVVYQEVASDVGIDFVLEYGTRLPFQPGTPAQAELLLDVIQRNMGNGAAVEDYDGDGDFDIYMLGQNGHRNILYRNLLAETGSLGFIDDTAVAGLENLGMSRVAMFVDLDNDRDPDLILINDSDDSGLNAPSAVYRNDGSGLFSDVTAGSGFAPTGYVKGGLGVTDYDQDGLLDIYVTNWGALQPNSVTYMPGHNRLYRNLGGFQFQDVTATSGLGLITTNGFGPVFADFDNDRDADMYLAVDRYADFYFRNDNGVFVNRTSATGANHAGTDMGVAATDFDQDGDLDLYCANATDPLGSFGGNTLLVNQLTETGLVSFPDEAVARGVHDTAWGWGVEWVDPDNNGITDIFVVNGFDEWLEILYDGAREAGFLDRPVSLFLNDGTGHFTEEPGPAGDSRTAIAFDADLDGDQDLLVTNVNAAPFFLRNDTAPGSSGNWLQVDLDGGSFVNRDGIGARVEVTAGGRTQQQELIGGGSYLAGRPTETHFGLGTATVVDELRVYWPGGGETVLTGLAVNQRITVEAIGAPEICGDGIDNDFDRRADCADFDCVSAPACSVNSQILLYQDFNSTTGSFHYIDDAFRGTSNPAYASGMHGVGGNGNGGVRVRLGGQDSVSVSGMSGGYESPFTLPTAADTVRFSFGYALYFEEAYEADECGQLVLSVDGILVSDGPDDFLVQLCGGAGLQTRTGVVDFDIPLASGNHTITVGAYNNKKDAGNEYTSLYLDNILVQAVGFGAVEVCDDGLDNDGDLEVDCRDSDCAADLDCAPEIDCNDGLDNDHDGSTDCADLDCAADPACLPEADCTDSIDNDNDGSTDCADLDCADDSACLVSPQILVSQNFNISTGSFGYVDDAFRDTSNPAYASGRHGFGGSGNGAVRVRLGGLDLVTVLGMSGGYASPFTLPTAADTVSIRFAYALYFGAAYEADECGQLVVSVDGVLVSNGPDDFLVEVCGGAGQQVRSGVATIDIPLASGNHTVTIGSYNNKKDSAAEGMDLYFDNIIVQTLGLGAAEVCVDGLDNDGDLDVDCDDSDCAEDPVCVPEIDSDYDGILDDEDNCPNHPNPLQGDVNGDGIGDPCQPDDFDHDGWPDVVDNCPDDVNPDQADGDSNGVGDVCDGRSMARIWNEQLLHAIRHDMARPTVHARNLYHVSAAMWDAWSAYDPSVTGLFHDEDAVAADVPAARDEAMAYAAYRLMVHRFTFSVGAGTSLPRFDAKMADLGYDINITTTVGDTPAAVGNRIAAAIIAFGATDGSNEANDYINQYYTPVNPPLLPDLPGNPDLIDPNRWQPLVLDFFIDQSGNPIPGGFPEFLSPEWGQVTPFALSSNDLTINNRDGFDYWVYHDAGSPPLLGGVGDEDYKYGNEMVVTWSSHLDPADAVMWDISPGSIGNSPLPEPGDYAAYYDFENGGDWGTGHLLNPITGLPYEPQIVPRGDYARVLAEFWADGPHSETPPGHWFTIANYVSDHPLFVKQMGGTGDVLDDLEWDVKLYLMLGGAMHDSAITAWGVKGWYDYIRPVSAIRYLADQGQSSDLQGPSYHPDGIGLHPGFIEVVTSASSAPGERHEHLAGDIGKIAVRAWKGPDYIGNEQTDTAGVDWILAENWWPYQRPTFVTPPFAGFVSGHSTYSRAASELMTIVTGSRYFPGGLGEFPAPQNEFLVFEEGPSQTITLQWATYHDASDQTSLSRIWGGIHPPADDIPGRIMGQAIGRDAIEYAQALFGEAQCNDLIDNDEDGLTDLDDPGCTDPNDQSESAEFFDDGIDNDAEADRRK